MASDHDPLLDLTSVDEASESTVFHAFDEAFRLYRTLLAGLGNWAVQEGRLQQSAVTTALEEFGRLRIWGQETRVVLNPYTRGSLDDVLRGDPELKTVVFDSLSALKLEIHREMRRLNLEPGEKLTANEGQEMEDMFSEPDSSDDDDEGDGQIKATNPPNPMKRIAKEVQCLYDLAMLMNRPFKSRKCIHSTRKEAPDPKIAHYTEFDYNHVIEKLYQWSRFQKVITSVDSEEARIPNSDDRDSSINLGQLVQGKKVLAARLAKANTKRREQLLYWSRHPDTRTISGSADARVFSQQTVSTGTGVGNIIVPNSEKTAATGEDKQSQQGISTIRTKQTFPAVPDSEESDPTTNTRFEETIYEKSVAGVKHSTRIPAAPKSLNMEPSFECPYCHLQFESEKMQGQLDWQRHIFRDLRPYVCTFDDCQNPDKQFATRREWIYHEKQMHRRKWVCEEHGKATYPTKELFIYHLKDSHPIAAMSTEWKLSLLAENSEQQIVQDDSTRCPLCPEEMSLIALETHLAGHLESLALFVLPSHAEDEESEEKTGSKSAAQGQQSSQDFKSSVPSVSTNAAAETAVSKLDHFLANSKEKQTRYTDAEVQQVSVLLRKFNVQWSKVPRTYIVLRTIGCLHVLDTFIDQGFSDNWLPFTHSTISPFLQPDSHAAFLITQHLVLTASASLEMGWHSHFQQNEPVPFEVKSILGRGRFGQVERVISLNSSREYARKRMLRRDLGAEAIKWLADEIGMLKRLKHRHLVELVGSYTDPMYFGLIMSPVAEMDLFTYLYHAGEDRHQELRTFFGCLARGLAFLHEQMVRHKNIKSSKILVHKGNVLFTGFGLSLDDVTNDSDEGVSMSTAIGWSTRYSAPEIAYHSSRNSSADIWSLGVVFLEMTAVLKGRAVGYIYDFLSEHGSRGSYVFANPDGFSELAAELREFGWLTDNMPLGWSQDMLVREQSQRPTAASLVALITSRGQTFCGTCCVSSDDHSDDKELKD